MKWATVHSRGHCDKIRHLFTCHIHVNQRVVKRVEIIYINEPDDTAVKTIEADASRILEDHIGACQITLSISHQCSKLLLVRERSGSSSDNLTKHGERAVFVNEFLYIFINI